MSEPDPILCICCPILRPASRPRRPNTLAVCDGCRDMLARHLAELPGLYAALEEHLEPGRGGTEIRLKGFESQPPMSAAILSLLGPGSETPIGELAWWASDWAGMRRELQPEPRMPTLCAWLADRLGWACDEHPAVDEFAADLRHISGAIKAVTGGDRGERVGRCPRTLTDGSRCDTQLYVDPYVDKIVCSRCHMEWNRRDGQWLHLRGQQLAAGVEAA